MGTKLKLGWFSTGRGEGSIGLLKTAMQNIRSKTLDAEIQYVFCNREPGENSNTDKFMKLVEDFEIPLLTFSSTKYRKKLGASNMSDIRADYDRQVLDLIQDFTTDVCALAGYMLIAGQEMCEGNTLLNLHPALPNGPTGTWQDVIWKLIEYKSSKTGSMIHIATPEVDRGQPLAYVSFSLRTKDYTRMWKDSSLDMSLNDLKTKVGESLPLFQKIRSDGMILEKPLLMETLKAISQKRITITTNNQVKTTANSTIPLLLNSEINQHLEI